MVDRITYFPLSLSPQNTFLTLSSFPPSGQLEEGQIALARDLNLITCRCLWRLTSLLWGIQSHLSDPYIRGGGAPAHGSVLTWQGVPIWPRWTFSPNHAHLSIRCHWWVTTADGQCSILLGFNSPAYSLGGICWQNRRRQIAVLNAPLCWWRESSILLGEECTGNLDRWAEIFTYPLPGTIITCQSLPMGCGLIKNWPTRPKIVICSFKMVSIINPKL